MPSSSTSTPTQSPDETSTRQRYQSIYYRKQISDKILDSELRPLITRIANDVRDPGDSIKLLHAGLMSARINIKARLIFKPVRINNKPSLLLVQVLDDHGYNKLKKNKNFRKLQERIDENQIQIKAYPRAPLAPSFKFGEEKIYKLSSFQCEVLDALLPLILSGVPGSGKTSTAISKMAHFVKQATAGKPQTIVYTTIEPGVTKKIQADWEVSDYKKMADDKNIQVLFKSYNELSGHADELNPRRDQQWLDNEKKKARLAGRDIDFIESEALFQEFDYLSGYSKEAYCSDDYGQRNTWFPEKNQREAVFDLFQKYQSGFISSRFSEPNWQIDSNDIAFIVCDESQDFSTKQLDYLTSLSEGRIIFCLDNMQNLINNLSIYRHLTHLLKQRMVSNDPNNTDYQPNCIFLTNGFRNPKAVLDVANEWIKIMRYLIGGSGDKREYSHIEQQQVIENEGYVFASDDFERIKQKAINSVEKITDLVIVAEDSKLAEAKEKFKGFLVLTPRQVKGLEYKVVFAYQPFSNEKYKIANNALKNISQVTEKNHQPKDNQNIHLTTALKAFFVTLTRAQRGVFIYQPEHNAEQLIALLKISENNAPEDLIKECYSSDADDWSNEVERLVALNKMDIALQIWTDSDKLHKSAEDFAKKYFIDQPSAAAASSSSQPFEQKAVSAASLQKEIIEAIEDFSIDRLKTILSKDNRHDILFSREFSTLNLMEQIRQDPDKKEILRMALEDEKLRSELYTDKTNEILKHIKNPAPVKNNQNRGRNRKNNKNNKRKTKTQQPNSVALQIKALREQLDIMGLSINEIFVPNDGASLFMYFLKNSISEALDLLPQVENINETDCQANTALHLLFSRSGKKQMAFRQKMADKLLEKGLDFHQENQHGESPAFLALKNMSIDELQSFNKRQPGILNKGLQQEAALFKLLGNSPNAFISMLEKCKKTGWFDEFFADSCQLATYLGWFVLDSSQEHLPVFESFMVLIQQLPKEQFFNILSTPLKEGLNLAGLSLKNKHRANGEYFSCLFQVLKTTLATEQVDEFLLMPDAHGISLSDWVLIYFDKQLFERILKIKGIHNFYDKASVPLNLQNVIDLLKLNSTELSMAGLFRRLPLVKYLLSKRYAGLKNNMSSPLFLFSSIGYLEAIKHLLDVYDIDVNSQQRNGGTALMIAAEKGYDGTVNLLLEYDADVNQLSNQDMTALYLAASQGHLNIVRRLLEVDGINIRLTKDKQYVPIYMAVTRGYLEIVECFLKAGFDVNDTSRDYCSMLYMAAGHGQSSMVRLLLEYKADVNMVDSKGISALHLAAMGGYVDIVEALLESEQINPFLTDHERGCTAVYLAAMDGHLEVIQRLSKFGAELINQFDHFGFTPFHLAVVGDHLKLVEYFLASEEAQCNYQDNYGHTPLHKAVAGNNVEILKRLMESERVDVNLRDVRGCTPLLLALFQNKLETAEYMLTLDRVDIFKKTRGGVTALHIAAMNAKPEILEELMNRGIDPNSRDFRGMTPLYYAVRDGQVNNVSLLLKKGVRTDFLVEVDIGGIIKQYKAGMNCKREVFLRIFQEKFDRPFTIDEIFNLSDETKMGLNVYDIGLFKGQKDVLDVLEQHRKKKASSSALKGMFARTAAENLNLQNANSSSASSSSTMSNTNS